MKTTTTISKNECIDLLKQVEKSTFINLVTTTKVRMNKKGNPYFDQVLKHSKCNYLIGNSYEDRNGTNGKNEGIDMTTFEVQENKVGTHISKVILYNEKFDKYYLQVERFNEVKPQIEYTFNDNPIEKVMFENYMTKVYENKNQPQEKKVMFISFSIDSIKEFTLNGTTYKIE